MTKFSEIKTIESLGVTVKYPKIGYEESDSDDANENKYQKIELDQTCESWLDRRYLKHLVEN
jgi:hypothetical protein